jgi:hypothetical protein
VRFWLAALALSLAPVPLAPALPQTAPSRPTGFVLGEVLDAATSRPVDAAIVTLSPVTSGASGPSPASAVQRVLTDSAGRFLFRNLAKGTFVFSATAPGYLPGGYGQRRPDGLAQPFALAEGQRAGDVTIRLWKEAALSGVVTDEAGGPVVGVSVSLARRSVAGGRLKLSAPPFNPSYSARTDDRGAYQFVGLAPGEYLVSVQTRTTAMPISLVESGNDVLASLRASGSYSLSMGMAAMSPAVRVGDFVLQTSNQGNTGSTNALVGQLPVLSRSDGRIVAHPPTFYPNVATASEATPITLKPGDDRSDVDLHLRPVVMVSVSGTVIGPNGPEPQFAVHLIPESVANQPLERAYEAAVTATDSKGAFTFLAVPPGGYVVKAWRLPPVLSIGRDPLPPDTTLWGETPVVVGNVAVTAVAVNLRPGLTLSGRLEFDGSARAPTPQQLQPFLSRCFEFAWPLALGNMIASRVTASYDFTLQGQPPGKYFPNPSNAFFPRGWYLESVTLDGKDLATSPVILDAQNITGIAIRFTDRRTELTGIVRDARGRPDANATVLVFPADYHTWIQNGMPDLAARVVPTSQLGTYSVADIRPGEYLAAAVSEDAVANWQQVSMIEALASHATRVTVARGETKRQDLRSREQ